MQKAAKKSLRDTSLDESLEEKQKDRDDSIAGPLLNMERVLPQQDDDEDQDSLSEPRDKDTRDPVFEVVHFLQFLLASLCHVSIHA
jgi:hypothetical protein